MMLSGPFVLSAVLVSGVVCFLLATALKEAAQGRFRWPLFAVWISAGLTIVPFVARTNKVLETFGAHDPAVPLWSAALSATMALGMTAAILSVMLLCCLASAIDYFIGSKVLDTLPVPDDGGEGGAAHRQTPRIRRSLQENESGPEGGNRWPQAEEGERGRDEDGTRQKLINWRMLFRQLAEYDSLIRYREW